MHALAHPSPCPARRADERDAAILPIGNLVHDSVPISDDEVRCCRAALQRAGGHAAAHLHGGRALGGRLMSQTQWINHRTPSGMPTLALLTASCACTRRMRLRRTAVWGWGGRVSASRQAPTLAAAPNTSAAALPPCHPALQANNVVVRTFGEPRMVRAGGGGGEGASFCACVCAGAQHCCCCRHTPLLRRWLAPATGGEAVQPRGPGAAAGFRRPGVWVGGGG